MEPLKGKNCKSAQAVLFGEQQTWTADSVHTHCNCSVRFQSCGALWLACLLTVFWVISNCVAVFRRTHTHIPCCFYAYVVTLPKQQQTVWSDFYFFPLSSPFEVTVGQEAGPQQIRAWGPGLEGGIVGKPATFVVESIGTDVGVLGEWSHLVQVHLYLSSCCWTSRRHQIFSPIIISFTTSINLLPKGDWALKTSEGVKNHMLHIKDGCCHFSTGCNFEPEMLPLNVSNLQFFTPSLT